MASRGNLGWETYRATKYRGWQRAPYIRLTDQFERSRAAVCECNQASSPRARSAWMSLTLSSPTDTRNMPSLMPAAARAAGLMRP